MSVRELARPELLTRSAYVTAVPDRSLIRLHANESPFAMATESSSELNRYPDPGAATLVAAMSGYYAVSNDSVLPVRGSDDGIDLLIRAFCRPYQDSITVCPPTFSMYASFAEVQGAAVNAVPLNSESDFKPDIEAVEAVSPAAKLVFVCSPSNPLGCSVAQSDVIALCERLQGKSVVVLDEAYAEFSPQNSMVSLLSRFSNLVILRTLSKAFAAAGIRCGAVLAQAEVIELLRSIMSPYSLPTQTIEQGLKCLSDDGIKAMRERSDFLVAERMRMAKAMNDLRGVVKIYPSDANFLLVKFDDAATVLKLLRDAGVLVRDFSKAVGTTGCLRISVGSAEENRRVLSVLGVLSANANAGANADASASGN